MAQVLFSCVFDYMKNLTCQPDNACKICKYAILIMCNIVVTYYAKTPSKREIMQHSLIWFN